MIRPGDDHDRKTHADARDADRGYTCDRCFPHSLANLSIEANQVDRAVRRRRAGRRHGAAGRPKTFRQRRRHIVENRPGQGGTLGSRAVAMADPDGYTPMMATSTTMGVSANLYKNLDFDPVKSFAPVALISSVPFVLVVRPSLPIKTAQEFVDYARANPGKLNFGFPTGTLPHLTGELFKLRTGIDVAFIPYKTANATISDLVSGQIDYTFEPASVLLSHINDGAMRPLAVTS